MTTPREIATDLLRRLLAGERGEVPMQLAMLLEKSSPSDHGDDHYRQVLPRELADLRLSPETSEEILAALCVEVSRNPDQALMFVISFSGSDQATKTVVRTVTNPPRPLTMGEYGAALALLNSSLPYRLAEVPEFIPRTELESLVRVVKGLQLVEEGGTNSAERVESRHAKDHASQLLRSLAQLGIRGS